MFSNELGAALSTAVDEARRRRHEFVYIENALWAMLRDPGAKEILRKSGADIEALTRSLEENLSSRAPASVAPERVYQVCSVLSDDEWQQVLLNSVNWPFYKGIKLPDFPNKRLQIGMVGSEGHTALHEAYRFYKAIKIHLAQCKHPLKAESTVLDFGCGWGRYSRYFLKDVDSRNLYGADVNRDFIEGCKQTFPYGNFVAIDAAPPTHFESGKFDLILAYSVFSHLSQSVADQWIAEFSRLLAPGGMLAVTTQGRTFINQCKEIRESGNSTFAWHLNMAKSFVDAEACLAAYDRGEFLFSPTGGGEALSSSFYGEALIPQQYVKQVWGQHLEFRNFIDDRNYLPQALIVMQKKQA